MFSICNFQYCTEVYIPKDDLFQFTFLFHDDKIFVTFNTALRTIFKEMI